MISSEQMRAIWTDPDYREHFSRQTAKSWRDPVVRARRLEGMRRSASRKSARVRLAWQQGRYANKPNRGGRRLPSMTTYQRTVYEKVRRGGVSYSTALKIATAIPVDAVRPPRGGFKYRPIAELAPGETCTIALDDMSYGHGDQRRNVCRAVNHRARTLGRIYTIQTMRDGFIVTRV